MKARTLGPQLRTAGVTTGSVHVPGKGSGKGVKRGALDVFTTLQVGNDDPGEDAST